MDPFLSSWFVKEVLAPDLLSRAFGWLSEREWREKLVSDTGIPRGRRRRVLRWLSKKATWDDLVTPTREAKERLEASLAADLSVRHAIRRARNRPDARQAEAEGLVARLLTRFISSLDPSYAVAVASHREIGLLTQSLQGITEIRDAIGGADLTDLLTALPPPARRFIRELMDVQVPDAARITRLLTDLPTGLTRCDRVRELVTHADWLSGGDPRLWLILGEFAATYDCNDSAGTAFESAASSGVSDQPRWLARAAMAVNESDPERALDLLNRAGQLKLDHPFVLLVKAMIDEDLDEILSLTEAETWGQDIHGGIAYLVRAKALLLRDQTEQAIDSCRRGVGVAPESSALVFELAQAHAIRAQSSTGRRHHADLQECVSGARQAQVMRREWGGDSAAPLALACRAAMAMQDWNTIRQIGRAHPDGDALEHEAKSQLVIPQVATAAAMVGDRDEATSLLEQIEDEYEQKFLHGLLTDDDDEASRYFGEAFELAPSADDRMHVQVALASQGKWPIPGIDETRSRDEEQADVIEAMAQLKRGQFDRVFPLLRKWDTTSLRATRLLVDAYEKDEQIDKAIETALEGHKRFGEEHLLTEAVAILAKAGEYERAEREAESSIAIAVSPTVRKVLRRAQVDLAWKRADWARVEQLASASLAEGYEDDRTRWILIGSIWNQHRPEDAWIELQRFGDLTFGEEQEARLWLELHRRFSDSADWTERALTLAERFRDSEEFSAGIIMALMAPRTGVTLAEPTIRKLHEVTEDFFARFPDTTYIERISAEDVEQLTEALRAKLEPGAAAITEIGDKVLKGELPIGMIAAATGKSYAESVVRLCWFCLPVECESPDVRHQEDDAARTALEKGAVLEASTLYVGTILADLWPDLRASLASLLITAPSLADLVQARDSLGMRSTGSVSWNTKEGRLAFAETSEEQAEELADAGDSMHKEALRLRVVPHTQFLHFTKFDDRFSPWLAALDVAKERGLGLFSDDALLRSLAHSSGVPAFGTLALLRVLQELGHVEENRARDARIALRTRHAVEMPIDRDEFMEAARAQGFRPGGTAFAMTRRSFWRDRDVALQLFRTICQEADAQDRELVPHWLYVATLGICSDAPPETTTAIAAGLLGGTCIEFGRDPAVVKHYVDASRQASSDRGGNDPFPAATKHMLGIVEKKVPTEKLAPYLLGLFSQLDPADRHTALRIILDASS